MKKLLLLVLLAVAATSVRAEWKNVKAGIDQRAALQAVGAPLLVSKSKSGLQVRWTYDNGAHILFERGRVRYWSAPKPAPVEKKK